MKFVISRHELSNLIRKIQNVVPQSAPIPILSHFLIEAEDDGSLVFTATDLTVGARCQAKAAVSEGGSLSIPSRHFFQLIRELTDSDIEVTSDSEVVEIKAGSSRFRLHGMDKSEFPSLPDLKEATQFQISGQTLKDLFYRTAFAVSKEDSRYALTGVLLRITNSRAIIVGTDGKRLAKTESDISLPADFTGEYILPIKAVDEIMKMLQDDQLSTVYLTDDKVAVESGSTIVVTRLLAGNYPDFEQIISTPAATMISLHREELVTLLRQISLFTTDTANSVRFTFTSGELLLTANSAEIGDGKVSMPVNYSGAKIEVAFNPYYFLDVLRHTKDETVNLSLSDAYNPGIITDSTPTLFIIMPMRLHEG